MRPFQSIGPAESYGRRCIPDRPAGAAQTTRIFISPFRIFEVKRLGSPHLQRLSYFPMACTNRSTGLQILATWHKGGHRGCESKSQPAPKWLAAPQGTHCAASTDCACAYENFSRRNENWLDASGIDFLLAGLAATGRYTE